MDITYDEQQLMAIFNTGNREGTIAALEKMRTELEPDEIELRELTATVLGKLRKLTDADFDALDLMLEFGD